MKFIKKELKLLWYWVAEREKIRIKKERGDPKPWTKDPILRDNRFCNVQREDDKVTIWIRENWRIPYAGHPSIYIAMILARLINWPPALEEIGFPIKWDYQEYLRKLQNRKMRGDRIWGGAYMVTAGGKPIPKEEAVCDMVHGFYRSAYRPQQGDSLYRTWVGLMNQGVGGMGTFLAAQVVADLKFTPLLERSPDWWAFCAPGPGSQAGLNHLLGLPVAKEWNQPEFQDKVNELRVMMPLRLSAQDTQNCLCEFSKYKRGFGKTKYPGAA